MKLSAPTQIVWIIAVILGVLGILGAWGLFHVPYAIYLLTAGFLLLVVATVAKGL